MGTNPPAGVVFHYLLADDPAPDRDLRLEILAADGSLIRTFTRQPEAGEEKDDDGDEQDEEVDDPRQLSADPGLNRFVWDLRYPRAERFPGLVLWNNELDGPRAIAGTYKARLALVPSPAQEQQPGAWSAEVELEVLADPRVAASADYEAQFRFHLGVRDKLSEMHREIRRLRQVRGQLEELEKRLAGREATAEVVAAANKLLERLQASEEVLYQTKNRSPQDPLNFPIRLNDKLAGLMGLASMGEHRPTASMLAVRDQLTAAVDAELARLRALWAEDLPTLNALAAQLRIEAVWLPE